MPGSSTSGRLSTQTSRPTSSLSEFSALHNEELHALKDPVPGAQVSRMCYAFSYIRSTPAGTQVIQMSHFNARVPFSAGMLSPRNVYNMVWPLLIKRAPRILKRAQEQAQKLWDPQRLSVPSVFLDMKPVTPLPSPAASTKTVVSVGSATSGSVQQPRHVARTKAVGSAAATPTESSPRNSESSGYNKELSIRTLAYAHDVPLPKPSSSSSKGFAKQVANQEAAQKRNTMIIGLSAALVVCCCLASCFTTCACCGVCKRCVGPKTKRTSRFDLLAGGSPASDAGSDWDAHSVDSCDLEGTNGSIYSTNGSLASSKYSYDLSADGSIVSARS